jgi:primase-polymerase (primpol)-like protein/predicted nucleic acid-binding Zn ribbon protein
MYTCLVCGVELTAGARGRKPQFCGSRCRVAAHRERRRVARFVDRMEPVAELVAPVLPIPDDLTKLDRWVRHLNKRPMAVGGWFCSVTDSSHWSTFEDAIGSHAGDGVGFVLNGDGIVCLDLDDCVVDGVPTVAAQKFLDEFPGAYVEFSPSGRGLHVWGRGFMDRGRRFTLDGLKVEAYPDGRYITVTGDVFRSGGLPVLDLHRIVTA